MCNVWKYEKYPCNLCKLYEEKGFNNGSMLSQDYTEMQALHVQCITITIHFFFSFENFKILQDICAITNLLTIIVLINNTTIS